MKWDELIVRSFHNNTVRFIMFRQLIAWSEYLNMFRTSVLFTVVTYHWIWFDCNYCGMYVVWGSHMVVAEGARPVGMRCCVSWCCDGLWCLKILVTQCYTCKNPNSHINPPSHCIVFVPVILYVSLVCVCVLMDVVFFNVISSVWVSYHWHTSVTDDAD